MSPDNLYEQNVAVNNGVYKVKAVEAVDEQYIYKTEYAKKVMMNGILKSLKREHTEQQGLWGKRNAVRF